MDAVQTNEPTAEAARSRRRYDSPLRRQRADETRDRIVQAGCELLGASSIRDWGGLTMRAVAERAGVNERTVYRHLGNERGLRDAVMRRMEQQAGIDLDELQLDDVADVARRIVTAVASHPLERHAPLDPTLTATARRQRAALLRALGPVTDGWSERDRAVAAGMLDALWGVAVYERLAVDWELDRDEAIAGISWAIGLIEEAIRSGRRPADDVALGGA